MASGGFLAPKKSTFGFCKHGCQACSGRQHHQDNHGVTMSPNRPWCHHVIILTHFYSHFLTSTSCIEHVFNFNPCQHCTPNPCTLPRTRSKRSYKWSKIERVHSQCQQSHLCLLGFHCLHRLLGSCGCCLCCLLGHLVEHGGKE